MSNPILSQRLMIAQLIPEGTSPTPSISRQKTREIFMHSEERKVDSFGKALKNATPEESERMLELMIE